MSETEKRMILLMLSRIEHDLWVARKTVMKTAVCDDKDADMAEDALWQAYEAVQCAVPAVRRMKWE